jgi:hypothetical protein
LFEYVEGVVVVPPPPPPPLEDVEEEDDEDDEDPRLAENPVKDPPVPELPPGPLFPSVTTFPTPRLISMSTKPRPPPLPM